MSRRLLKKKLKLILMKSAKVRKLVQIKRSNWRHGAREGAINLQLDYKIVIVFKQWNGHNDRVGVGEAEPFTLAWRTRTGRAWPGRADGTERRGRAVHLRRRRL